MCTAVSCSYIWSCEGKPVALNSGQLGDILHFDIYEVRRASLHAYDYVFNDSLNSNQNTHGLTATLNRELGHIAGLAYCPPGEKIESCAARLGSTFTDPAISAVMYKFPDPEANKLKLSSDDLAGIKYLYGEMTGEEKDRLTLANQFVANVDSPMSSYEISELAKSDTLSVSSAYMTEAGRLFGVLADQKEYLSAYTRSGDTAESYLLGKLPQKTTLYQKMRTEMLQGSRIMLLHQIRERDYAINNFSSSLDPLYLKFLMAEKRMLIQIRRDIINEQSNR